MNNKVLIDYSIKIKPSNKLREVLKEFNKDLDHCEEKTGVNDDKVDNSVKEFCTDDDYDFISSIENELEDMDVHEIYKSDEIKSVPDNSKTSYMSINDLVSLNKKLRQRPDCNVFLHELLENSRLCIPTNEKVERNPDLEKRCALLRTQQDNLYYKSITKNVDNTRYRDPEESISYQMKQINKQLIAVAQFIISVLSGFAFGFIGIELLVGNLDFGFRLLLGIICALIIALAELYFLAKHLAEE